MISTATVVKNKTMFIRPVLQKKNGNWVIDHKHQFRNSDRNHDFIFIYSNRWTLIVARTLTTTNNNKWVNEIGTKNYAYNSCKLQLHLHSSQFTKRCSLCIYKKLKCSLCIYKKKWKRPLVTPLFSPSCIFFSS